MKQKILITGGTGLVGSRIIEKFDPEKYSFHILSRSQKAPHANVKYFKWDLDSEEIDIECFEGVSTIITLAGAGIADKRWTESRKKVLIDSRVKGNKLIADALKKEKIVVDAVIAASAVGYYGNRGDTMLTTASAAGTDGFLSECTVAWEASSQILEQHCKRFSLLRIGIVLSTKGGALEKMLMPLRFGISGYFGSGNQYYSWIHIDDLIKIFDVLTIDESYSGIFNGVNSNPLKLKEFAGAIKKTFVPFGIPMPVPAFGLKLAMGEMTSMLTNSTKVTPNRLLEKGFTFDYEDLTNAVNDLVKRKI